MKYIIAIFISLCLVAPAAAETIDFDLFLSFSIPTPFIVCDRTFDCSPLSPLGADEKYIFEGISGGAADWYWDPLSVPGDTYIDLGVTGSQPDTVRMSRFDGQTFDLSSFVVTKRNSVDAIGTFDVVTSKGASQSIASTGTHTFTGSGFEAVAYVDFVRVNAAFFVDIYHVDDIDVTLNATPTAVGQSDLPPRAEFLRNVPNPFNPNTAIRFRLNESSRATLRIYDIRGRLVRTLLDAGTLDAGEHDVVWDGRDAEGTEVGSGTYFSRLVTDDFAGVQQLTLVK